MSGNLGEAGFEGLFARKPNPEMPEFDITAMVDLVFMMNIYFLVTFVTLALSQVDMPPALHCVPLDADSAVVITLAPGGRTAAVYLGDNAKGTPVMGVAEQDRRVHALVERGVAEGKTDVLLKAEKDVRLGDVFRMATVAATVEGVKLHVGVMEKDVSQ
jgi:biopolymer transport protein ExbD